MSTKVDPKPVVHSNKSTTLKMIVISAAVCLAPYQQKQPDTVEQGSSCLHRAETNSKVTGSGHLLVLDSHGILLCSYYIPAPGANTQGVTLSTGVNICCGQYTLCCFLSISVYYGSVTWGCLSDLDLREALKMSKSSAYSSAKS